MSYVFIFTAFVFISEWQFPREDIEVIEGEVVIHRSLRYEYGKWGNLTPEIKTILGLNQ